MSASITDENYLVSNQGKHPLVNFNFMLRVELLFDLPCKSVKAFSRELEYDYIQEGGLNDYVHMRRKPLSKPHTLEVERYVGVDYFDPMPLGADLVLPVLLFVSRYQSQFIPFLVARTYVFTGCTVMKKNYGELSGDKSGLLIETTTLGYREMLCVDIPWSMAGQNLFDNKVSDASNAIAAMESLDRVKQLSQSAYEKIENAEEQAKKMLEDIKDKISKLPAAIKNAESAVSDAKKTEEEAKATMPSEAGLTDAEADFSAKRQELKEKKLALDNVLKELDAAKQAYSSAKAQLKAAQNAQKAAAWKADYMENQERPETDLEFAQQLAEALETKTKADERLATAGENEENAKAEQTLAEEKVSEPQTEYDSAKAAADEAEEKVAAARSVKNTAEKALKEASQAHNKAKESQKVLVNAEKGSETRQKSCEKLFELIPDKLKKVKEKNEKVQEADELSKANRHYPEVQSQSSDIQKAIGTISANQSYFANLPFIE
ncbi:MAG: hypothetical protein GX025_06415 [Clostridiales bacterium]|nr:hypothetical protein [Clostridiales bacterium]